MSEHTEAGTDARTQNFLWESYIKAGQSALTHKNPLEATRMFSVAMEKSKSFGGLDWRQLETLRWLSMSYFDSKDYDRAETYLIELLDILFAKFGGDSPELNEGLHLLAMIYEQQGKYRKAAAMIQHLANNHPKRFTCDSDPDYKALQSKYRQLLNKAHNETTPKDVHWIN